MREGIYSRLFYHPDGREPVPETPAPRKIQNESCTHREQRPKPDGQEGSETFFGFLLVFLGRLCGASGTLRLARQVVVRGGPERDDVEGQESSLLWRGVEGGERDREAAAQREQDDQQRRPERVRVLPVPVDDVKVRADVYRGHQRHQGLGELLTHEDPPISTAAVEKRGRRLAASTARTAAAAAVVLLLLARDTTQQAVDAPRQDRHAHHG